MPFPTSSPSGVTQRPDLAEAFHEYPIEAGERGFIGTRVLPVRNVAVQRGEFGRIPVEQLLKKRDVLRAPKSGYSRSEWSFEVVDYATREYGAEEPVDDREAAMYRNYFEAELESAMIATDSLLRAGEVRIADKVFDTSVWTGSSLTTAVSTAWDQHSTATPIADVAAAVKAVWDNSGLRANAIVMSDAVFRDLRQCAEIVERIESAGAGGSTLAGEVTQRQLAQAFDLSEVIVSGGTENTANEGQDASFSEIWNVDRAMVCRVATSDNFREPCIGRTFSWLEGGGRVDDGFEGALPFTFETYREDAVRGDVVRVRHDVDNKILYKEAGHLLTGLTT